MTVRQRLMLAFSANAFWLPIFNNEYFWTLPCSQRASCSESCALVVTPRTALVVMASWSEQVQLFARGSLDFDPGGIPGAFGEHLH